MCLGVRGRHESTAPLPDRRAVDSGDDANEVISPLLGLPELPVLDWPDPDDDGRLHWKTRGLVGWAAGRSFVWVDDEIADADRAWVSAHHHGQALLHRVDSRRGLTRADFTTIADWLARL